MIAKTKRIDAGKGTCLIYQRGIGYYFQTQYIFDKLKGVENHDLLNHEIFILFRKFTDIKKWKIMFWLNFKPQLISEILDKIIAFNIPMKDDKTNTYSGKETNSTIDRPTEESLNDIYDVIHNICFYYSLSFDYVLENISLIDALQLNKRITQTLIYEATLTAMAYHDPKKLRKLGKQSQGYEFGTINDVVKRRSKDPEYIKARERAKMNREMARQERENQNG